MKVFVTGGNGFLGSRTVSELIRRGHSVRLLLRKESRTERISHLSYETHLGDILEPKSIQEGLKGCDAVIHLACISSWGDLRKKSPQIFEIAVEGTRNVLEAAAQSLGRSLERGRVVYVSSIAAIGASSKPQVFDENATYNLNQAQLNYSLAKHQAERVVDQFVRGRGLDAVIVNPCEAYGPDDDDLVTAGNLIEVLKGPISLVCQGGTSIAHVEDLARGIVLALEKGRKGERYILGGDNLSLAEIAQIVRELAGKNDFVLTVPNRVLVSLCRGLKRLGLKTPVPLDVLDYAVLYWYMDSSKAQRELGHRWRPAKETFQDVVQWLIDTRLV
jgi:dihydroflavonol-4-reductase